MSVVNPIVSSVILGALTGPSLREPVTERETGNLPIATGARLS